MLDYPKGTHKFYNRSNDVIFISSSACWIDFKPWEAENLENAIRKLKFTTLGKINYFLSPSAKIILKPNAFNEITEEKTLAVPIIPTAPLSTKHIRRVTRSIASGDDSITSNIYS